MDNMIFKLTKQFRTEKIIEPVLEKVEDDKTGKSKAVKVDKERLVEVETTNRDWALEQASQQCRGLGYIDYSLEEETDKEYIFSFYNLIDLPRSTKEKNAKRTKTND